MGDDITIGVTEIVNNIEVTAQPNDQIVDISVIDNADDVTLNITPTVIEINVNKGSSYAKWGTILGTLSDQEDLQDALDLKADLVDGKVPSSQLPSYVDDVIEVANYAALPATGETGKIYVTIDNNKIFRWTGSTYVEIIDSAAVWGAITGTLSSQTDLQNALNLKANDNAVVKLTGDQSITGQKTFNNSTVNSSIITNNSSSGYGIRSVNTSTGIGFYSTNTAAGSGIYSSNGSTGKGIESFNSSTGYGIYSTNGSTGTGIYYNNTSTGKNLVLNNTTAATGMPFTIQKQGLDVFTINDAGGVYAAGSVGIGTSSPSYKLDVNGDISLSNGSYYKVGSVNLVNDTQYIPRATTLGYFVNSLLYDNGTNVGIGTTSPTSKLHVDGNIYSSGYFNSNNIYLGKASVLFTGGSVNDGGLMVSGSNNLIFGNALTERMRITSGGNVGIGIVPETWSSTIKALQIGTRTSLYDTNGSAILGYNIYSNTTNKYIESLPAMRYIMNDSGHTWQTAPSGTADADITYTDRMIITSGGNVGIGTTSPNETLTLYKSDRPYLQFVSATTGTSATDGTALGFTTAAGEFQIRNKEAQAVTISTSDTERMRITSGGNLLLGTSSDYGRLSVLTSADGNGTVGYFRRNNAVNNDFSALEIKGDSAANTMTLSAIGLNSTSFLFEAGGAERMRITSGGNVGINTASPTSKLQVVGLPSYADNTTALAGGLTVGAFYHTAGVLKVVI